MIHIFGAAWYFFIIFFYYLCNEVVGELMKSGQKIFSRFKMAAFLARESQVYRPPPLTGHAMGGGHTQFSVPSIHCCAKTTGAKRTKLVRFSSQLITKKMRYVWTNFTNGFRSYGTSKKFGLPEIGNFHNICSPWAPLSRKLEELFYDKSDFQSSKLHEFQFYGVLRTSNIRKTNIHQ
jgi:hypothetical protein